VFGAAADPMKDFSAPTFDVTKSGDASGNILNWRLDRARWKFVDYLTKDAERFVKFLASDGHAALDIAFGENWNFELNLVVEGVREIAAEIMVKTGSAPSNTDDSEVASHFRFEDAGCFQTIARGGGAANEFDE